jgi:hypothetical protein
MRGHVRLIAARGLDPRGLGKARLWHGRKFSSIVLAVVFAASAFTYSAAAPGSVAAAGCYTNVQTGPAKYKIERQFIYIDGTGDAFLKFNGTICYNGSTAYVQNGSPDSWVANRTGLVPSISRGVFTDGGGTVHVWTDMKFTRSCGSETFVGWVQLRLWFYKGGGWSDGWYKSSNGKCATEIHWR